jgi:predicted aldo/keto reductase-like oxidoreductase
VDLYQFHGLDKPEELAQVMGPDGALEAFQEARQQGLIRFIGITSHRPDTLLKAIGEFQFDSVVLPYNFIFGHYGYGKALLEEAWRQGLAVSAIKPLAESCWGADETHTCPKTWYKPFTDEADVRLCVRWILGQRVTTAIPSGDMRLFRLALAAAQQYTPLTAEELAALDVKAAGLQPLFPNA